ncbi:MAG: hypothetical protein WKG00_08515 [Polyangiaceae bacterium]
MHQGEAVHQVPRLHDETRVVESVQIAEGQLVRTAAMDGGFADTAHLTRTFRAAFGTTATAATADRR